MSTASVWSMRSNGAAMKFSSREIAGLLLALGKELHVVHALVEHSPEDVGKSSASDALSLRSANAISGSIIQNSARWRVVFEFSARNVGPNVYTLLRLRQ